jgi:hypothetical protein
MGTEIKGKLAMMERRRRATRQVGWTGNDDEATDRS